MARLCFRRFVRWGRILSWKSELLAKRFRWEARRASTFDNGKHIIKFFLSQQTGNQHRSNPFDQLLVSASMVAGTLFPTSGMKEKGFPCKGDCESSIAMKVRCKAVYLLGLVPLLFCLSIIINFHLYVNHQKIVDAETRDELNNVALEVSKPFMNNTFIAPSNKKRLPKAVHEFLKRKQTLKTRHRVSKLKPGHTKEIPPANPASLSPNATFSACLLIKDDNEILDEWIAYHYFVIKLRQIIVAVDPLSREFPSKILQKWRTLTDLEITEWSDENYMPRTFLKTNHPPPKFVQKASDFNVQMNPSDLLEVSNHRYRQRVFLAKCMSNLRERGKSWVIHIDTDEYVVPSKLLRQMMVHYVDLLPMDQPGSVLHLLQQAVIKTRELISYPCISMLRVLFGSVESSYQEIAKDVPPGFNATTFESLRWHYHALPHNMTYNGNPKVILDMSAIPDAHFPADIVYSIHRPVQQYCQKNKELSFTSFRKQPIAVNHYLGSWERYSRRNDKRRRSDVYQRKAEVRRGKDDGIRPWLSGFVNEFGHEKASILLGWPHATNVSYEIKQVD